MRRSLGMFLRGAAGLGVLGLGGCVEPYLPEVIATGSNFLVVDGFIKGNGVTRIRLSRTANIATTTAPLAERGARLFIVDNLGQRYALTEKTSGNYQSDSLLLDPTRQYQLRLTTVANVAYESALVPLKVTPPITKLDWQLVSSDVKIQLNTQDPSGQSRYYRWGIIETWEFTSAYQSYLEYNPTIGFLVYRTTPIYRCWRTERPTIIKQGSSAQLSQDAILDTNFLSFPRRAERFKIRYSVLVSQVAETAEEFAYYELLRKNTEAVGTVNDPLPVQLTGNVHRVDDPQEPVLGFVGAHTVQQRRLFIDNQDLPYLDPAQYDTPYQGCFLYPLVSGIITDPNVVPVDKSPDGVLASSRSCIDCRVRGTNKKPGFW